MSEKSISHAFTRRGIRTRKRIEPKTFDRIFKLHSKGQTILEIARTLDISYSTIHNYFLGFKDIEILRNAKNTLDITHNEAIERLITNVPKKTNITIYSEHLS